MEDPLDDLLDLLDLEEIDLDIFRGRNERTRPGRIFGGQVAAQSLVAAARTVSDLSAHSLHGYFLRPGDPDVPVVFTVDRLRDGASFVTRNVVARQRGRASGQGAGCRARAAESGRHPFEGQRAERAGADRVFRRESR